MKLKVIKLFSIHVFLLFLMTNKLFSQKKYTGYIKYIQVEHVGVDTLSAGTESIFSLFYNGEETTYLDLNDRKPITSREAKKQMSFTIESEQQPAEVYS